MIRILVVEDQPEKKRSIIQHLISLDQIALANISHAENVIDAKRLIKSTRFDLLILDINIPKRIDEGPSRAAGLEVIHFIKNNVQAKAPAYIYGMTAFDDAFVAASPEFSSALWKLVKYSPSDNGWQASLAAAVAFLVSQDKPPFKSDGSTFHIDVGIVCALEEELSPFKQLFGESTYVTVPHDPSRYLQWSRQTRMGEISIVAVAAPRMGLPTASVTAAKLINAFRPRFLITSGICAGVKEKAAIGDILIADPCFDWGSGKWVKNENGLSFKPAAYPWRLSEFLRQASLSLGEDKSFLSDIACAYKGKRPGNDPVVLIDAMASGGSVLQAESLMTEVRSLHKNLIGIDMENYGVLTAVEYCGTPQATAIAVKSVCDFGDGNKNDDYHGYAAHVSASFVCKLIDQFDCGYSLFESD